MHVFFHGFFFCSACLLINECSSRSETMTSNNVKWQDVTKKKKYCKSQQNNNNWWFLSMFPSPFNILYKMEHRLASPRPLYKFTITIKLCHSCWNLAAVSGLYSEQANRFCSIASSQSLINIIKHNSWIYNYLIIAWVYISPILVHEQLAKQVLSVFYPIELHICFLLAKWIFN